MTAPAAAGEELARTVVETAIARGVHLATAESLTAGDVVARLVDVPGASACVLGGAACYTEEVKCRVLGVDADLLAADGAVTAEVARQMAQGALRVFGADLAVSTTGVAGPGADARGTPAGTVFLAVAQRDGAVQVVEQHFVGTRPEVRTQTVVSALRLLAETLRSL